MYEGREAIRGHFQAAVDNGFTTFSLEPIDTRVVGDTAYRLGSFAVTNGEGTASLEGYFMAVLTLEEDGWRIHRLVGSVTEPPPDEGQNPS